MHISMHLNKEPFDKIKNGSKSIEMRLCDGARRFLTNGDTIEFVLRGDDSQRFICDVVGVHIYSDFEELYKNFSKSELGYLEDEVADPKDMEKYYPLAEQKENCVMAIEVKVQSSSPTK